MHFLSFQLAAAFDDTLPHLKYWSIAPRCQEQHHYSAIVVRALSIKVKKKKKIIAQHLYLLRRGLHLLTSWLKPSFSTMLLHQ